MLLYNAKLKCGLARQLFPTNSRSSQRAGGIVSSMPPVYLFTMSGSPAIPVTHCLECGISFYAAQKRHCQRRTLTPNACPKALIVEVANGAIGMTAWTAANLREKRKAGLHLWQKDKNLLKKIDAGKFSLKWISRRYNHNNLITNKTKKIASWTKADRQANAERLAQVARRKRERVALRKQQAEAVEAILTATD